MNLYAKGYYTNMLIDITTPITPDTVTYPGDPIFQCKPIQAITNECPAALHELTLCNHLGTHIDFPSHVIPNGKTSSDYDLNDLHLTCQVIDVPLSKQKIDVDFLSQQSLTADSILFKTSNSTISKQASYQENFVSITPEASELLVKQKLKLVGIDYLSVDDLTIPGLPVHKNLLANDILILENCDLMHVEAGYYQLFVMPLKIAGLDGLPVRAFLFKAD